MHVDEYGLTIEVDATGTITSRDPAGHVIPDVPAPTTREVGWKAIDERNRERVEADVEVPPGTAGACTGRG